jgi:hypothetical protein
VSAQQLALPPPLLLPLLLLLLLLAVLPLLAVGSLPPLPARE